MTTTDQIKDAGAAVDQPIHVEIISDYQRFLVLEPAWNELVASAGLTYPFLEHVWIRTWWECFGEGHKLRILAVREGMKLIAIAPLMLTPVRMWGVWLYKLGLLWNNHVPRADFIITRRSQETYRAI